MIETGPAWAIYVEQMAEAGVSVRFGEKTPDHFYREAKGYELQSEIAGE